MSFQAALTAIGSSADYSHALSAPLWLVHVYARFAGGRLVPPPTRATADLGGKTTSATSLTTPPPPNYFVIIDAVTGQVIVENY
jgi:hypothetical protein